MGLVFWLTIIWDACQLWYKGRALYFHVMLHDETKWLFFPGGSRGNVVKYEGSEERQLGKWVKCLQWNLFLCSDTFSKCYWSSFIHFFISGTTESGSQPLHKEFPQLLSDCSHCVRMYMACAISSLFVSHNSDTSVTPTPKSNQYAAFELISQMLVQSLLIQVRKRLRAKKGIAGKQYVTPHRRKNNFRIKRKIRNPTCPFSLFLSPFLLLSSFFLPPWI